MAFPCEIPKSPKGKRNLYEYVNRIPNVAKNFIDSGRKVTFEFQKILGAITSDDSPVDNRLKEMYEKAKGLVYNDEINDYTKKYKQYEAMRDQYQEAHRKYLAEQNKAEQQ